MVVEIPLTQGMVALVDDEDAEEVLAHKWHTQRIGQCVYAKRRVGPDKKTSSRCYMHRIIIGALPGEKVDHINHDGLDNRRCNLRLCTSFENMHNRRKVGMFSSRYKGVCWHKKERKWQAEITANGRLYYLGAYDNEIEAAQAYDDAAKLRFGKFACVNFDDEGQNG